MSELFGWMAGWMSVVLDSWVAGWMACWMIGLLHGWLAYWVGGFQVLPPLPTPSPFLLPLFSGFATSCWSLHFQRGGSGTKKVDNNELASNRIVGFLFFSSFALFVSLHLFGIRYASFFLVFHSDWLTCLIVFLFLVSFFLLLLVLFAYSAFIVFVLTSFPTSVTYF